METLQRTANRGSISTGNYEIDNSLKFEADNTEIIYRTNESGTNRKTFTTSLWFKRTELGATQEVWHGGRNGELVGIGIITYSGFADQLWIDIGGGSGNTGTLYRSASNQKIRDTSAWYHVCLAVDTTQGTEANRMKVWLNGVEVTSWEQHQIPVQNYQGALESGTEMAWGGYRPSNSEIFSGYLAECHYLDGVAKVQTDFGEYDEDSGIWIPKKYTGTYGNNGCYMKFDDSSSLGADSSGNGNTFTLTNIAAADQATDTPTNNFCVMNVNKGITYYTINGPGTLNRHPILTNGATVIGNNSNNYVITDATMAMTSGKWYWEIKCTVDANTGVTEAGIASNHDLGFYSSDGVGNFFYQQDGSRYVNGAGAGYGAAWATNDIMGFAYDADNWTLTCFKNNSSQGNLLAGTADLSAKAFLFKLATYGTHTYHMNFGGYHFNTLSSAESDANGYGSFEYAPPTGYYALCTKNLAEFG